MNKKVAVVGSGISGIVSAYLLDSRYDVTLIEADERLGGHTHTEQVMGADGILTPVDMGFIVFNLKNYPLFTRFLEQLEVSYQDSDMSFGFYDRGEQFWYSSDFPQGIFSQTKNLFSLRYLRFLTEINTFNSLVLEDLDSGEIGDVSLKDYLDRLPVSDFFKASYVYPMGAAIWSCPIETIYAFPAKSFFSFWRNHALLTIKNRPTWKTVSGGSRSYIQAFLRKFQGKVMINSPVRKIQRQSDGVTVYITNKEPLVVDSVIIATHADQALALLEDPTKLEKNLLGQWSYSRNKVFLHSDKRVMPPKMSAWASWVVQRHGPSKTLNMTYYMNRLQSLESPTHFFVTLNDDSLISSETVHKTWRVTHPVFDRKAVETQALLSHLNSGYVRFCGSYFGYGFHEDGVRSAVETCKDFGVTL